MRKITVLLFIAMLVLASALVFADDSQNIPETNFGQPLNINGNIRVSGAVAVNSDGRLTQNIVPLTGTLSKLDQLRGVSFEWNHLSTSMGHKEGEKTIGMIAQELQKVYPELVKAPKKAYLSIDYMKFTAVLLQVAKEQQKEIKELQERNEQLRARMDALEKKLTRNK